jgi:hypothetical protein
MQEIKQLGGFSEHKRKDGTYQTGYTVYDKEGVCPTLLADGGGYGIMIIEEEKNKIIEDRNEKKMKPILIYDTWNNNTKKVTDVVGTLTLQCGNNGRACGLF